MQHQQERERLQSRYILGQTRNELISLCAKEVHEAILLELQQEYYFLPYSGRNNWHISLRIICICFRHAFLKNRSWEVVEPFLSLRLGCTMSHFTLLWCNWATDFKPYKRLQICSNLLSTLQTIRVTWKSRNKAKHLVDQYPWDWS